MKAKRVIRTVVGSILLNSTICLLSCSNNKQEEVVQGKPIVETMATSMQ